MASQSKFTAAALVAAVALLAVGCSTAPGGGQSSDPDGQGAEGLEGTLNIIAYTGGSPRWVEAIEAFEAAYPDVTVEVETLPGDSTYDSIITSRIQGNTAPDLFEPIAGVFGLIPYADAGLVNDLSAESWVGDQLQVVQDAAAFTSDKTYGFVTSVDPGGLYYNTELFEENGITPPTNWDELLVAVDQVKKLGITPITLGGKDVWPLGTQSFIWNTTSSMTIEQADALRSGEAKYSDSEAWREILGKFQELNERGAFDPDAMGVSWPSSAEDFANGGAAMMFQVGTARALVKESNPDLAVGFTPFQIGDRKALSVAFSSVLAEPVGAKNSELGRAFLDFLAQPENQEAWATTSQGFPSFPGVAVNLDATFDEMAAAINDDSMEAVEYLTRSGTTTVSRAALQSGMQGLFAGTATIDDVLAAMDATR